MIGISLQAHYKVLSIPFYVYVNPVLEPKVARIAHWQSSQNCPSSAVLRPPNLFCNKNRFDAEKSRIFFFFLLLKHSSSQDIVEQSEGIYFKKKKC